MNPQQFLSDDHDWVRCPACGDDLMVPTDPDERVAEIKRIGQFIVSIAEKYRDPSYWPTLDPEVNQ